MSKRIPVCEPFLNGNELEYVMDAVRTGWISSAGIYVKRFEEGFASYCGAKHAVGICNGTSALHVALRAAGICAGDEVIIPDFTMIATAFSVCYTGAKPVSVDAEAETWNIDPEKIESRITKRTKAIMPVSIFGHPCDMDAIGAIARAKGILVIEDAAESVGAEYKGRKTGTLADITAFSFYANKNLTTGEGGMVVTNNLDFYKRAMLLKNLFFPLDGIRNYLHEEIGFNYRMSNLQAAIGLAQLEKADEYRRLRTEHAKMYRKYLIDVPGITMQKDKPDVVNVNWMNGIVVDAAKYGHSRDELMSYLARNGVETRLFFVGMHRQPSLLKYGCNFDGDYNVTDWLSQNGFYLPSGSNLAEDDIRTISDLIAGYAG
ncbi:MAG TPA: DegT/DnrJ/EryC1/StrS family aminotransferase [Candidatus Acidoferrales bacterium]|nr:DegT/DnrJ/EryC1/StrS family aminotransferase [Candidatus Acidoferrales bacterium]